MEYNELIEEAKNEVETICENVQQQLTELEEKGNEESHRMIEEAREKLAKLIADSSKWLKENTERDKLLSNLTHLRDECMQLLGQTKEKAIALSKNEDFQATLQSGKDFIVGSGRLIASGMRAGADKLMENDKIATFVNKVNDKVEDLKEDERVQEGTQRLREGTMKIADRAYDGIKRFLNKDDEEK
ncbi:hypothetical protein [Merdibacter massiliensis]|uniref:hypothetical protein n=1 Tax=Merdibacter massiliensis TaxID=1871030 RepID=UPI00096AA8E2|nr:hypothetical protein [Merdibacter massiliensis]